MTMQLPQPEEQPPLSFGEHDDAALDLARRRHALRRTGAAPSRLRPAPDYRLRGLDLGGQGFAEAPARPLRKGRARRRSRRLLIQWVVVLTLTAMVAVGLRASVVQPFSVRSTSMVPTLQAGTDVLVVKPNLLTGPTKVGDIIVFHEPRGSSCSAGGDNSHQLVKRVIGLPGETIWSAGDSIYVNGQRLNEPGWYNPPFGELGPTEIARTTIPPGSYFVMGDNRTDSCDSRSFGPIAKSLVVGRVVATISRNGHPFVHSI